MASLAVKGLSFSPYDINALVYTLTGMLWLQKQLATFKLYKKKVIKGRIKKSPE